MRARRLPKDKHEKRAPINQCINEHCNPHLHLMSGGQIELLRPPAASLTSCGWYAASIVELLPRSQLRVRYAAAAHDKGAEGVVEYEEVVPLANVRPRPPPNTTESGASSELLQEQRTMFGNTEVGDRCEMLTLGGWWQVRTRRTDTPCEPHRAARSPAPPPFRTAALPCRR
jgi:hypothetical protein